jgi:hypothetical protein
MHASLQKQVAFNRRVLKNEELTSGINADLADFLQDMGVAAENPVFVCVNVGERMRGTQPVCGQLWTQEDGQISAVNMVHEGLDSSRESVALFGIYDALSWRRAMEISMGPNYRRPGQRIIAYPKFLDKLGVVLATGYA